MNNLNYTVSDGTTIYLVPTNSRHTISFSEVNAMYLHILNSQGKQVAVFPVNYDDDGVYWALGQLGGLAGDTYAFYLELKYSDTYSEYYPDNSVKYFTVIDDENAPGGQLLQLPKPSMSRFGRYGIKLTTKFNETNVDQVIIKDYGDGNWHAFTEIAGNDTKHE